MIGMINAHMSGTFFDPDEGVEWSEPDVLSADDWGYLLGITVEEYAEANPHMIVFEVAP